MEYLQDLFRFIKRRKKYWLAPVIMVLMMMGLILIFAGSSPIGPFLYSLF